MHLNLRHCLVLATTDHVCNSSHRCEVLNGKGTDQITDHTSFPLLNPGWTFGLWADQITFK